MKRVHFLVLFLLVIAVTGIAHGKEVTPLAALISLLEVTQAIVQLLI